MPVTPLEIDGSYLEGGGQILRIALSLSCLTGRPVRVIRIRANRPNPGLSNQHLYGLDLLQQITNAEVRGKAMKSTEIEFHPGDIKSGKYTVNTGTAAAVSLVMQAALPVLLFGRQISHLELIGGTNVGMAPQVDFMTEVLRPNLERFGVTFDFDLMTRGYYPRGGGICGITVPPVRSISPANLTKFGTLEKMFGWCFVAGTLPPRLAEDMKRAVEKELQDIPGDRKIEAYKESPTVAKSNGSGVILTATTSEGCTVGASSLGERNVNAQQLGSTAAKELKDYVKYGTCVDKHVQDQLIIFMALADGISSIRTVPLTNHTKTAIHVAELMTAAKFTEEPTRDGHVVLSCMGIGHKNMQ